MIETMNMPVDTFTALYLGTPYSLDGRDRNGIDCWGLVVKWYELVLGEEMPDFKASDKSRAWAIRRMTEESRADIEWLNEPRDHSIAFGRRHDMSYHAGIYYNGVIIHSQEGIGVVVRPEHFAMVEFGGNISYGVPRWLN